MAHTLKLTLMVGESGSGKSTSARELAQATGALRLSRDDLRLELKQNWSGPTKGRSFEEFVIKTQFDRAALALKNNQNVIIDDTNLNQNTRNKWEKFALHKAEFDIYRITTPLDECIRRDANRIGTAHVGRAVIERQFLMSGRLPIDITKDIILVDVDGTLADHTGIRNPFDEEKVHLDKPFQNLIDIVNAEYDAGKTVIIISGRHSTCGDSTIHWLNVKLVKFHFILMRHGWDSRKDYIVKEEILNELLKIVPKEKIVAVYDDRPQVILECWRKNNLPIFPVYKGKLLQMKNWTIFHKGNCKYTNAKGYGKCPQCGAMENF